MFEIRDLQIVSNNSVSAVAYSVVLVKENGVELPVGSFCKFGLDHNSPQDLVSYAKRVGFNLSHSPYPRKPASYC